MSTKPDPTEPATTPPAAHPDAVAQNLELVIERLKDIRHLGPQTHFSDLAKEALVCARAALAAVPKPPIPPLVQSLPNSGLEPDWNGYAKEEAAQVEAKHLVDAVTAVMSKHGLIDHLTLGDTERFCDELLTTFTAASAAAPQVAADERRAFENKFPGVCGQWNGQNYGDNRCQRMWEVWQARATLAAAPVQAQELVIPVGWCIVPTGRYVTDAILLAAGNIASRKYAEMLDAAEFLYEEELTAGRITFHPSTASPAQPVAAPAGWKWMPTKATGAMADAGAFSGLPVGAAEPWIAKKVWEAMAAQSPAAPAAQGDAKELTDEHIYDIAASCGIGIGHNDHETSQRFEFARAILADAAAKAAS